MHESYCGKVCSDCMEKQEGRCSSCLSGPGRPVAGDCEIAACARDKGHTTCSTCSHRTKHGCSKYAHRDDRLKRYLEQQKAAGEAQAAFSARAAVLAKWMKPLFWLVVPSAIASILANDTVANLLPGVKAPGQYLQVIVTLAYGIILICMQSCTRGYFTAGICTLAAALADAIAIAAGGGTGTLLITIPAAAAALYGEYKESTSHGEMLSGSDSELAEKWALYWKWYIGLTIGTFVGIFLILLVPVLGALVTLAAAIGMIVISILKLIYLYRTMKTFTTLAAASTTADVI